MTQLLALAAVAVVQGSNPALVTIDPTSPVATVQAIVKVGPMGARDRAALAVVVDSLHKGTESYSQRQIREVGNGSFRASLMPDHVRISYEVAPADISNAMSVVGSVLREPLLSKEAIAESIAAIPSRNHGYWRTALSGERLPFLELREADVREVYRRVFRPENVWAGIGGKVDPEVGDRWDLRMSSWTAPRAPLPSNDRSVPEAVSELPTRVSVLELRAAEWRPRDVDFPTKLMALIALGSGKASSIFRVTRDQNGWSYHGEALLWPTATGFQPRIMFAQRSHEELPARAEQLRLLLMEDVKNWSEPDRQRALGMARGILKHGIDYSPMYFEPASAVNDSITDRVFLAAYWRMKTGMDWNPDGLLASMQHVRLDEMKEIATDILATSTSKIYKGQ